MEASTAVVLLDSGGQLSLKGHSLMSPVSMDTSMYQVCLHSCYKYP